MRSLRILPALLFLLLLGGCVFPSGDELLAAPKPSSNYQSLQTELEKQLAQGVSYASPSEGENRSSIQLADLDNDGVEEAITFFRGATSATSNKFTVAVYRKQDDSYVCTGTIDGRGTALRSVEFPVLEPSGKRGMVLTWRLPGDGTGALTMCDFDENCTPGIILETEYTAMELTDLTGNGAKDLLLITSDTSGKRVARLYQYDNGSMLPAGETATSQGTAAVERMQSGRVQDSKTAVFAEEKVANGAGLTTDIFVYSNDTLRNLALDGEDTASHSTYRPVAVYASDVNGDGIIDDKDITPTGFSNVPRFAFSSNLSFGYKGFEISALLTGSAQGTFNMNGYLITPFAQGNGTPLSYMNGRWTPERHAAGKQITFPRMSVNMANSQNNQNNSFWFRSTDHIKLKNVEVAYTFRNARWMRKAHIGSIRVFVNANNLCTWGGKDLVDGIDPELVQDGSTSEGIIYPLTRVYNFGFNIQF